MKLTDKTAIRVALLLAIDTEESLIDSYTYNGVVNEKEEGVIIARRRIEAFKRVLKKYYGVTDTSDGLDEKTKPISIWDLMKTKEN